MEIVFTEIKTQSLKLIETVQKQSPLLARFFSGQVVIQFLNLLNGFLLLRWLSIENVAIFSMLFGIQTLMNSMSDLGFSGSIIALTGNRYSHKKILGGYISSAKQLRRIFFLIIILIMAGLAPFLLKNNFENNTFAWLGFIPVVASVYWQADCSIYASPLIIHKQLKAYYKPQILTSVLRILINYILYLTNVISALSVLIINALVILYMGKQNKKNASNYFEENIKTKETKREMLRYLAPIMPSNIFNSFFGQIQIFIIAYFGSITNIAEVGALGRLSQLFLLLSAFNMMIVEPAIAKTDHNSLFKKYIFIAIAALFISFFITWSAYSFPDIYLWVLGNKYSHLDKQLVWLIAAAGVNFLSTTIWTMSSARKWVFWWGTAFYITTVILCQLCGILTFNLATTTGVLQLSLLTAIGILIVQLSITIVGFQKEKRLHQNLSFQKI